VIGGGVSVSDFIGRRDTSGKREVPKHGGACLAQTITSASATASSKLTTARVTNTKLCLQKMRGRSLRLKPCSKNKLQQFKDYSLTEKFDLRPVRYSSRCLSQHHHPKQDEEVYAETCAKAHRHDTGYWIAY
ncbi:hypothetical protein THAOC_08895, partial [Thalassiosira oceanica]